MIFLLTDLVYHLFEFYRLPLPRTDPALALECDRFSRCTPDTVCRSAVVNCCVTLRYFHFSTIFLLTEKQKLKLKQSNAIYC